MKKSFLYSALFIAVPLLITAKEYRLIIHTSNGKTVEYATKDIEKMEFVEELEPGSKLQAPTLEYERLSNGNYVMTWSAVPQASYYTWNLDGSTVSSTDDTSYTLRDLSAGTHTFSVKAVAGESSPYFDSEYTRVTFEVPKKAEAGERVRFIIENYTHNWARITFSPGPESDYTVAVIPAADAETDAAVLEAVNNLPADKKYHHNTTEELQFSDLQPSTTYKVVSVSKTDKVYYREFTTEATPVAGETHTVFPNRVSMTEGYVDVDKVGDTIWGNDSPLCWACVTANMCQWWIDDYKATEGKDYPIQGDLPTESLYYCTPFMDVISQAYVHQAGVPESTLRWFFAGVPNPENYGVNDVCAFNLDNKYVYGGFMGMTDEACDIYFDEIGATSLYKGMNQAEVKATFADKMIGWLRNGPVYFNISRGNHALLAWGAEYTIQSDGSKVITKLFVAENDNKAGNVRNGLNEARVEYTDNSGSSNYPYIYMETLNSGGGPAPLGDIGYYTAIRSWDAVNGK